MNEEFSAGVNILLQRMGTHPEEFYESQNRVDSIRTPKWQNLMNSVMQVRFKESARGEAMYLTDAEIDALYEGYSKIRRKAFDDYVMDTVLNPEQKLSSSEDMISKMQGQMGQPKIRLSAASNNVNDINAYGLQGTYDVNTDQYTLRGASASAAQAQAQHIAAHQEATGQFGQELISKITKGLGFK